MTTRNVLDFNVAKVQQSAEPLTRRFLWHRLHLDWPLLGGLIVLFGLGLLVLYSAKLDFNLIEKQVIRITIAMGLMICVAQIPPRLFRSWALLLYCFSLLMLVLVLVMGDVSKGAQRWLDFGIIRFQPAELMKIALPLMVARYLDDHVLPPKFSVLIMPMILIFCPVLLTALQPDLGTAILIASSGVLVIFFSGISWKWIGLSGALGIACTPLLWLLMHDYQRQRVLTLLNPERDPLGSGYHIIQSKIAIGSGGMYGKGWLHGTQSHLEFLPERTTDFIFAVFGEEFGLLGILFLLTIYSLIIIRGLYIGVQAQDTFCRLLAGGLTMTFFVYVFVNIGMVSGILPVVGIPLPLISYGGTSLVTLMVSFGMLMSIQTHRTLVRK